MCDSSFRSEWLEEGRADERIYHAFTHDGEFVRAARAAGALQRNDGLRRRARPGDRGRTRGRATTAETRRVNLGKFRTAFIDQKPSGP